MISQQKFSFLIGCCIVGLFLNILTWLYFSMAGLSSGPAAAADGAPTLPSPVAVATETPAATASTDIAKSPPRSFSSTKWPAFSKGYERVGFIGEGAYASVYRAKCLAGEHKGKICAIKVLNLEKQKTSVDIIAREVETMKLCKHENVLELHAAFNVMEELWLVMPFMNKGSVLDIIRDRVRNIKKSKSKELPLIEADIQIFIRATCAGLNYLHTSGWVHRDIKAANILVNDEGHVKIADFGVAGLLVDYDVVHGTRQVASTFTGTPCWMAPEVMKQNTGYSNKADIWSLGITTLELAKTYAPYAKEHTMKVLMKTMQSDPPSFKTYEEYEKSGDKVDFKPSRSLKSFLPKMLHKSPEKRNTAYKLLSSTFLKSAPSLPTDGAPASPAWQRFKAMLQTVCSVEDKREPEPNTASGAVKVAQLKFNAIKRKCSKRAEEENIPYEDAIRSELEQAVADSRVSKLVHTQMQQEMETPPATNTVAVAASSTASACPVSEEEPSLLHKNEAAMFVDPDKMDSSFLTADPETLAEIHGKVTGRETVAIPEVENEEEALSIEEQLKALEGGFGS